MRWTVRGVTWALLALALQVAAAVPETPQFRALGVADGLPSSGVTAIAQDRAGYVWLATKDGLARYDGIGFARYQFAPGDPASLPGNHVQALHIDGRDRVWVAVEGQGLSWLDVERGGFQHIRQRSHPELRSDEIWAIASTPDGAVWFGSFGGGLYRRDAAGRIRAFVHDAEDPMSLPADNVLALAVDEAGQLWAGTTAGVARYAGAGFERIAPERLSAPVVFSLSVEAGGRLWMGTPRGLDVREPDGRVRPAPWREALSEPGVTAVLRDRHGTRWIATRRGLNRERDGRVEHLRHTPAAESGLLSVLEDHEGGLWFGTNDQGVLRLPPGWRQFGVFSKRGGDAGSLANAEVQGMAAAGVQAVWLVGNGRALDRLDLGSGEVEHVVSGEDGFPYHRLYAVQQRVDGSVWVGHQQGVSRLDPVTRRLSHWGVDSVDSPALPGPVSLLCETPDGLLWSASMGYGLQARDGEGHVRHQIAVKAGDTDSLADPEQLLVGPDGVLWLATAEGLWRWGAEAGTFTPVAGAPAERIYGALFQPPETLWLHRLGALEAYRWNGSSLTLLRSVGVDAGLPAVESGGLLADGSGGVWLTTPRGLLRYEPVSGRLRQYGERDGLPSQEFVNKPPLMTPSGIAVASTARGVMLFEPAQMRSATQVPTLVLDALSVRRAEDEFALERGAGAITLQPDDRDLRVSARLLSFADAQAHRYRFQLHGYDPDWVDTAAVGERVFSRLEAGDYRLEVKAADADGNWSSPIVLALTVLPPWWLTPWAFAGFAALALLLLLALAQGYRLRLKRRHAWQMSQQRRQLAEQSSQAKSHFLATLGHEIRTPMTGVLGMAELLLAGSLGERQRGQVSAIQSAGRHLLRLLNDALDLARIEAGKLSLDIDPFDLHALLDEASDLLRPLAETKGLSFRLQLAPECPRSVAGDAGRVRQIVLNLGNNAIKFTERGEVRLQATALQPEGVMIAVHDSGPGLSAEQQARLFQRFEQAEGARTAARYGGSGLGLAICRELAAAMAGRIEVFSQPGQGACFRVCLPLPSVPSAAVVPVVPRAADAGAAYGASRRILLVEDDPLVAEVLGGLLQGLGHQTQHAPQALAALTQLSVDSFDLAFLDLDLPGMDGLQLARLLRAQGHTLPLVALTARADGEAESAALDAGMSGFLRKPVTSELLAGAIAGVCAAQSSSGISNQSTR